MGRNDNLFETMTGIENVESELAIPQIQRHMNNNFEKTQKVLDELRERRQVFTWSISGTLATGVQDGIRIIDKAATIKEVVCIAEERGNTATAILDITRACPGTDISAFKTNILGKSIFTSDADRIQIQGLTADTTDNYIQSFNRFDEADLDKNDILVLNCSQAGTSVKDVTVKVFFEYTA